MYPEIQLMYECIENYCHVFKHSEERAPVDPFLSKYFKHRLQNNE